MLRGVMTFAEAAKRWGIDSSTLRHGVNRFKEDEYAKSGKVHLVTKEGMMRLYGLADDVRGEMIERLVEEGDLLVDSGWVKKNDEEVYEFLLEMLESFIADSENTTTEEDLKDFEEGEWLVEYYFDDGSVAYAAGEDRKSLNQQPDWGKDEWENVSDERIRVYHEKIKEEK